MTLAYEGPPTNGYSASERTTQQQQTSPPLVPVLTNGAVNGLIDQLAKGITDEEVQPPDNGATNGNNDGLTNTSTNELAKAIAEEELAKGLSNGARNGFANELAQGVTDATNGVANGVSDGTRAPHPSISSSDDYDDAETTPGSSVSSISPVLSNQNKLARHVQGCEIGHCAEGCRSILQLQAELEDKRLPQWLDSVARNNAAAAQV